MLRSTRTCYGVAAQTDNLLGLDHEVPANSSLNTALTDPLIVPFQPVVVTQGMETVDPYDASIDTGSIRLKFLCIGNRGHRMIVGSGVPYADEIPHKSTDSGAYGLIPFVVKPTSADLTQAERARYRMRKTMLIAGTLYAAYYCRVLDLGSVNAETTLSQIVGNDTVTSVFNPTINNLRPPIPSIGAGNDGSYTNVSALTTVAFDATDIALLEEACLRVFGDTNTAIISEILLCTGVDKSVLSRYPDSGTQTPLPTVLNAYKEVVGVQVSYFTTCFYPANQFNQGLDITIDLGTTEVLFGTN